MALITDAPPTICRVSKVSPRIINEKKPAHMGSKVAIILARVERMWLIPIRYSPNGRMVPNTTIYRISAHWVRVYVAFR